MEFVSANIRFGDRRGKIGLLAVAGLASLMIAGYQGVQEVHRVPLVSSPDVVDFGRVAEGTIVRREILLENTTGHPLHINNIETSCGCTTVSTVRILPPRAVRPITVTFDSAKRFGKIDKFVQIWVSGYDERPTLIHLTGNVAATFMTTPPMILLGQISSGETKSIAFTVSRIDGKPLGRVRFQSQHVVTRTVAPVNPTAAAYRGLFRANYLPGDYEEDIRLYENGAPGPSFKIPLTYTVAAEYKVVPKQVNLGIVPAGSVAVGLVRLTGRGADSLRVVACPEHVSARLDSRSTRECLLHYSYVASGSRGHYTAGEIVVATHNGKQPKVVIPVYAAVS